MKFVIVFFAWLLMRLPPCGGSGLKSFKTSILSSYDMSPSVWREWIEIIDSWTEVYDTSGLPPCGGSGLKFGFKNPKLASITGLPPCGGSGLKYHL